ncbi:MAG TPA: phytanoyl-CoA dioxygenase family protein [Planctomycetota bacterium]|nr:phytanoyl-CoA dioxygenase family protein [Planctomycetota bacterium]
MLNPEEALSLDLRGYFVRRGAVRRSTLDVWKAALSRLEWRAAWELPPKCLPMWTPTIEEYRIINLLQADPAFDDLIDFPGWIDCAHALVPSPPRMTECYSITRGPNMGLFLHRTHAPIATYSVANNRQVVTHLKVAVCLDDCGVDDGPFCVIEGSHKIAVDFPYSKFDGDWRAADRDQATFEFHKAADSGRLSVPWREIPGFREIHTTAGDVVLFTENLIHGACARRADGFRRTLYVGYGPYHCANWHGVEYGEDVLGRLTDAQRAIVREPYCGHIYHGSRAAGDVTLRRVGFDVFPNSEAWNWRRAELRDDKRVDRADMSA